MYVCVGRCVSVYVRVDGYLYVYVFRFVGVFLCMCVGGYVYVYVCSFVWECCMYV